MNRCGSFSDRLIRDALFEAGCLSPESATGFQGPTPPVHHKLGRHSYLNRDSEMPHAQPISLTLWLTWRAVTGYFAGGGLRQQHQGADE